jgi:hypothetical protein
LTRNAASNRRTEYGGGEVVNEDKGMITLLSTMTLFMAHPLLPVTMMTMTVAMTQQTHFSSTLRDVKIAYKRSETSVTQENGSNNF